MTEIICHRTPGGFEPTDRHQLEELLGTRIPVGETCKVKVTRPRNLQFHRKFFAMIRATFDMQDEFETVAQWRAVVTVGAGHCSFVPGPDGQTVAVPKSVAFQNMDGTEFARLYEDALTFICARYVNDSPDRLNTVLEFT
jgi:hypothetical protein